VEINLSQTARAEAEIAERDRWADLPEQPEVLAPGERRHAVDSVPSDARSECGDDTRGELRIVLDGRH